MTALILSGILATNLSHYVSRNSAHIFITIRRISFCDVICLYLRVIDASSTPKYFQLD